MLPEPHWERLSSSEPADVCRRALVEYEKDAGSYCVQLLDRRVLVNPAERSITWGGGASPDERPPGFLPALVSAVYLIDAKEMEDDGEWVTGESLPAGAFFFRGPHALPTAKVEERFGNDRDGFLAAGKRLGGRPVDMGDACIELQALPRVPLRLVLWVGDDEFPSKVTMLFDRNVHVHLRLDALLSTAEHVVAMLLLEGGKDD